MTKGKLIRISVAAVVAIVVVTTAAFLLVPEPPVSLPESELAALDLSQQTLMAWGTWAIFVVSGLGLVVSGLALVLLRNTLQQNTFATNAAKLSADAARESTNAVILAERAFLALESLSIASGPESAGLTKNGLPIVGINLRFEMHNYGRSMATGGLVEAHVAFAPIGVEFDMELLEGAHGGSSFAFSLPTPIAANDHRSIVIPLTFMGDIWSEVFHRRQEAIFYGKVSYWDIFRQKARHFTYAYSYIPTANGNPAIQRVTDPMFWESN